MKGVEVDVNKYFRFDGFVKHVTSKRCIKQRRVLQNTCSTRDTQHTRHATHTTDMQHIRHIHHLIILLISIHITHTETIVLYASVHIGRIYEAYPFGGIC